MAYLEKRYLRILKRDYALGPDQISNDLIPNVPKVKSLLALQDYLSKVVQGPPDRIRIYNGYWRRLLDDALAALPRRTGLHDAAIYIGEVPDPIFNAAVEDCGRERYLILIQSGLELFLYRIALVLAGSMRLRIGPAGPGQSVVDPEIDMVDARAIITRNIEALFRGQHERPVVLKSDELLTLGANYAYALQQFVIAHEIGHILQSVSSFADSSGNTRQPPLASRPHLKEPWNKELVADSFAETICHELICTVTSKGFMAHDAAENVLFEAPYIAFALMEAMDRIAEANGLKHWQTHPPASLRRSKLLGFQIAKKLPEYYQQLADERSTHVGLLTGLIPISGQSSSTS